MPQRNCRSGHKHTHFTSRRLWMWSAVKHYTHSQCQSMTNQIVITSWGEAIHRCANQENFFCHGLALTFDGRLHVPRDKIVFTVFFLMQLCVSRSVEKQKRQNFVSDVRKACLFICSRAVYGSSLFDACKVGKKTPKSLLPCPWVTSHALWAKDNLKCIQTRTNL